MAHGIGATADGDDGMIQLWLATDGTADQTARALYAASGTAALLARPVELALRDGQGVRFRQFGADGDPLVSPGTEELGEGQGEGGLEHEQLEGDQGDGAGPSDAGRGRRGGAGPGGVRQGDPALDAGWAAARVQIRTLEDAGHAEDAARTEEIRLQDQVPHAQRRWPRPNPG